MLIKKSITLKKHRTSLSLEMEFWEALYKIAEKKNLSIEKLISEIDIKRESNLRMKNELSWLRPGTRKEIWTKANYFYDIWIENQKCGMWRMRTITGLNLDNLLKNLPTGGCQIKMKTGRSGQNKIVNKDGALQ